MINIYNGSAHVWVVVFYGTSIFVGYLMPNPIYIYISGAETGLVLLMPSMTNNSVNVIQNGLKIIH